MEKLLIVGCGDVARRALPALLRRYSVHALVRSNGDAVSLERLGVSVHIGDLDRPESLAGIGAAAERLLHLAPPSASTIDIRDQDLRTRHLISALSAQKMLPRRVVYISTSGVYGDCRGDWIDEQRPVNPQSARARRRVDAEHALAQWAANLIVLRVPGIYAADRLPLEHLRAAIPVLRAEEDVYTNHVHADDLAAVLVRALDDAAPALTYNVVDDSEIKMGDWFDLVADRQGLPRPPRVPRVEAEQILPPMLLSFMSESRRLSNLRLKRELNVGLRYPTVHDGVPFAVMRS